MARVMCSVLFVIIGLYIIPIRGVLVVCVCVQRLDSASGSFISTGARACHGMAELYIYVYVLVYIYLNCRCKWIHITHETPIITRIAVKHLRHGWLWLSAARQCAARNFSVYASVNSDASLVYSCLCFKIICLIRACQT